MSQPKKLGDFLIEVSNWQWSKFTMAEHDDQYTTNESIIFALVRACAMEKLDAIKSSLNRIDGKLKTPVKLELPKIYNLYPYAVEIEGGTLEPLPATTTTTTVRDLEEDIDELPSLTLRQTVSRMSDFPRDVPNQIIGLAEQVEEANRGQALMPEDDPLVKSVIAAHLLVMAQRRDLSAVNEVFDQIDGKLVEVIKVLGDGDNEGDLYITSYSKIAPNGAYRNADGVLQFEAEQAQSVWNNKLGQ